MATTTNCLRSGENAVYYGDGLPCICLPTYALDRPRQGHQGSRDVPVCGLRTPQLHLQQEHPLLPFLLLDSLAALVREAEGMDHSGYGRISAGLSRRSKEHHSWVLAVADHS